MAIEVEAIKAERDDDSLTSNELGDAIEYDVSGLDSIVVQLGDREGLGAWPTSLVVTLQCSLDRACWSAFPSGALTYTGFGVQAAVNVAGLSYVRAVVTTVSSGGHGRLACSVNGVREVTA